MSKAQTPKVGDLIEMYWWDHAGRNSWVDKGDSVKAVECRSVGWVEAVTKQSICTYGSETSRERVSEQANTLRSCITRLTVLQRAKTTAPKWTKQ